MNIFKINKTKNKIDNKLFLNYSDNFKNLITNKEATYTTKVSALYNNNNMFFNLYLDKINKKHTKLELFIGNKKAYYELQFNPYNFKNEVFFIEQKSYTKKSSYNNKFFSLIDKKPDVLGGFQDKLRSYKNNPYWAFKNFKLKNLKIMTTINKKNNTCNILVKIPCISLNKLSLNNNKLKINFFRFEKNNIILAYKPYGIYDCHYLNAFPSVKLIPLAKTISTKLAPKK